MLIAGLLGAMQAWSASVTLVPAGAVWKCNDTGTDLFTAWREPAYSEFALAYPVQSGLAFELVQQNAGVPSGTVTSATWTGLQTDTDYEWFAGASDGKGGSLPGERRAPWPEPRELSVICTCRNRAIPSEAALINRL